MEATAHKGCFRCGAEKPLTDFYKHKGMKDGHLGKCKPCSRADSGKYRAENIDRVRAYDRARGCRLTPEYHREYRARFPAKYRAKSAVNNAIRDGKLVKLTSCEECGTSEGRLHGHHDDYALPLSVRWLCAACHHQWHAVNGEARNAG